MLSVFISLSSCDHSTLKLLNKLVKPHVTTKWYDLGIELLEVEDLKTLDEIQNNYPRDASMCCTKMFQSWLDGQPEASWRQQLLQALRELNIEMNKLANKIEQKLISINESNVYLKRKMFRGEKVSRCEAIAKLFHRNTNIHTIRKTFLPWNILCLR